MLIKLLGVIIFIIISEYITLVKTVTTKIGTCPDACPDSGGWCYVGFYETNKYFCGQCITGYTTVPNTDNTQYSLWSTNGLLPMTLSFDCVLIACHSTCSTCVSSSEANNDCTQCSNGRFLSNSQSPSYCCDSSCLTSCVGPNSNQCNHCPANKYLSPQTGYSYGTCNPCFSSCASCSGSAENNCLTCVNSRTPYQGICCDVSCLSQCVGSANNQCSDCASNKYLSSGTCTNCHASCSSCNGGNSNNCLSCSSGSPFNGFCCHSSCAGECPF